MGTRISLPSRPGSDRALARRRAAIEDAVRGFVTRAGQGTGGLAGTRIEAMETRVLLSGYALSQVGYFGANASGANPQSTLVADSNGNLFGTTSADGAYGCGTVFEIAHGSNAITTLAAFNRANGEYPMAGLTVDASGNLFGTTQKGGAATHNGR
jgi:uncharacterized repeat protein (TIGR03803 family)